VVVVGAGFGGLTVTKELRDAPVTVTLVDRSNHHLFQPLLYQVAMAALSPAEIAVPIRAIVEQQRNTRVLMAEVTAVDVGQRRIVIDDGSTIPYDFLILAAGAETNYYGHDQWATYAPGLKTIQDATEIRRRVLLSLELAERVTDDAQRKKLLTFVVIGGGPTGVELAGAVAELSHEIVSTELRTARASQIRVVLLEMGQRILPAFDPVLSEKAAAQLAELGVDLRTETRVTNIDAQGVWLGSELIPSTSVLWTAGVRPSPLAAKLGVPLHPTGRIVVEPDCSIDSHPEVFAIGDIAAFRTPAGELLPGISPVAMQQARFVARAIERTGRGEPRGVFHYVDKGIMATIGRSRAVAQMSRLRLSGLIAWLAWLTVHIWYLVTFRNRLAVFISWCWAYIRFEHGARLIVGSSELPGTKRHTS
jgi:NADH dehydrogenase